MEGLLKKALELGSDIKELSLERESNSKCLDKAGVYAVWWIGDKTLLKNLNRNVTFKGKKKKEKKGTRESIEDKFHIYNCEWDWGIEEETCLYVGKATSILKRLNQHIMFGTTSAKWLDTTPKNNFNGIAKRNSTSQIRAGIEHLYINQAATSLEDKIANIGLSTIKEINFKERFYLEDLAIGYYRPWFNLDSER